MSTQIFGFTQNAFCEQYNCGKAIDFYDKHHLFLDSISSKFNCSTSTLIALVGPELTYYSYLKDGLETLAAEMFYAELGKSYGNFSIGLFQMKPSFIEELEHQVRLNEGEYANFTFIISYLDELPPKEIRKERVNRIKDIRWPYIYLCLFHKICEQKTMSLNFKSEENQLKYFATLYNTGIYTTRNDTLEMLKKKLFPRCIDCTKYNYAEISLEIYKKMNAYIYEK